MNLLNRILILMQLIALVVLAPILIIMLLFFRGGLRAIFEQPFAALSADAVNASQIICVGILTLIAAFSILLILLELQRGAPHRMRIQSVQGTEVLMTSDAITQQLEYALEALTDVIRVRPRLQSAGKGHLIDADIELWTAPPVDVQAKTQEVTDVARQVLEERLGLKVGKIRIRIDQMRVPKQARALTTSNLPRSNSTPRST
jgi:uncharacterized alkaline shock family protein YloU